MGHIRSGTKRNKTSPAIQVQTQRSAPYTDYDSVSSGSPNATVAFLNPAATEAHLKPAATEAYGQTIRFD